MANKNISSHQVSSEEYLFMQKLAPDDQSSF